MAIRFGNGPFMHHAAGWYPVVTGAFAAAGLPVVESRHNSGGYAAGLLRSGELDFITVGGADALLAGLAAGELCVLAAAGLAGACTMIAVAADSPITQPADLRGKRIAIQSNTGTAAALLAGVLPAVGLASGDCQFENMLALEGYQALLAGRVDAAAIVEVHASRGVARGEIRILFDFRPYDLKPMLLVGRTGFVDQRPADTALFLDTYLRAMWAMRANSAATAAVVRQEHNGMFPDAQVSVAVMQSALTRLVLEPHLTPDIVAYLERFLRAAQAGGQVAGLPGRRQMIRLENLHQALVRTGWEVPATGGRHREGKS